METKGIVKGLEEERKQTHCLIQIVLNFEKLKMLWKWKFVMVAH